MEKKSSASSALAKPRARSATPIADSRIDFSDIAESTDEELACAIRVGRPRSGHAKQLIGIRIDPRLLAKLRQMAQRRQKPYQTLVHELLEEAVKKAV